MPRASDRRVRTHIALRHLAFSARRSRGHACSPWSGAPGEMTRRSIGVLVVYDGQAVADLAVCPHRVDRDRVGCYVERRIAVVLGADGVALTPRPASAAACTGRRLRVGVGDGNLWEIAVGAIVDRSARVEVPTHEDHAGDRVRANEVDDLVLFVPELRPAVGLL